MTKPRIIGGRSRDAPGSAGAGWNPRTLAVLAGLWIAALPNWPLSARAAGTARDGNRPGARCSSPASAAMIAALIAALLSLWPGAHDQAGDRDAAARRRGSARTSCPATASSSTPTMMTNVLQTDLREVRDLLSLRLLAHRAAARRCCRSLAAVARAVRGLRRCWPQAGAQPAACAGLRRLCAALLLALLRRPVGDDARPHELRYLINPLNIALRAGQHRASGAQARRPAAPQAIAPDARHRLRAARRAAAAAGAGGRRDGARRSLRAERLRAPTNARAGRAGRAQLRATSGPAAPTPPASRALHVLAARQARRSRRATATARTCSTWCSAPAWRCCGSTTRPAARACATACRSARPRPARTPAPSARCADGDDASTRCCSRAWTRASPRCPPSAATSGVLLVMHQMGSHGPAYSQRSPPDAQALPARMHDATRCSECGRAELRQCLRQLDRLHRPRARAARSTGSQRQRRSYDTGAALRRPTTASRWARTACSCTACRTRWRRTSRSTCR